jgi:hypothetical protein
LSDASADYRGALEAVERVLNRGGDAESVLLAVLDVLHVRGVSPARISTTAGGGRSLEARSTDHGASLLEAPVVYEGTELGSLTLGASDEAFVERVATLVSSYVAEWAAPAPELPR